MGWHVRSDKCGFADLIYKVRPETLIFHLFAHGVSRSRRMVNRAIFCRSMDLADRRAVIKSYSNVRPCIRTWKGETCIDVPEVRG